MSTTTHGARVRTVGLVLGCAILLTACPQSDGKGDEPPDTTIETTTTTTTTTTEPHPCGPDPAACLYEADVDYDCSRDDPSSACDFETFDIVDTGRAGGDRDIQVGVYTPPVIDPPPPVVVLSHGGAEGKDLAANSLPNWGESLVNAGLLVVAVAHHGRDQVEREALCADLGISLDPTDPEGCLTFKYLHYDRTFDVQAVLDWLEDPTEPTFGTGDLDRIALVGHSAGSGAGSVLDGASRVLVPPERFVNSDDRIDAYVLNSPQGPGNDGFDDASWDEVDAPTLYATGVGDATADEPGADGSNRTLPYDLSPDVGLDTQPVEKYLLYLNDPDALHTMFELNVDACSASDPLRCVEFRDWIESTGLAFLDAQLRDSVRASEWLATEQILLASNFDVTWSHNV